MLLALALAFPAPVTRAAAPQNEWNHVGPGRVSCAPFQGEALAVDRATGRLLLGAGGATAWQHGHSALSELPVATGTTVLVDEGSNGVAIDLECRVTDPEDALDPATLTIIDGQTRGDVVNNNGTVHYTPYQGESRIDTFDFQFEDMAGQQSNVATVHRERARGISGRHHVCQMSIPAHMPRRFDGLFREPRGEILHATINVQ